MLQARHSTAAHQYEWLLSPGLNVLSPSEQYRRPMNPHNAHLVVLACLVLIAIANAVMTWLKTD